MTPLHFDGLPEPQFYRGSQAEGIPSLAAVISPLYQEPFLKNTLQSRAYQTIYSPKRIVGLLRANPCPAERELCEEALWLAADHAPRPAVRHGPDRRGDSQDPETGREAGESVANEPPIGFIQGRNSFDHGLHRPRRWRSRARDELLGSVSSV